MRQTTYRERQARKSRLWSMLGKLVGIYLVVVLLSSIIGWFRIGDVRDEFRAGAVQASCRVLDHVEWRELECNGYYDKVIKHRDERLHKMGCVNVVRWHVEGGNAPYEFNLWSLPLCWRPTFTL